MRSDEQQHRAHGTLPKKEPGQRNALITREAEACSSERDGLDLDPDTVPRSSEATRSTEEQFRQTFEHANVGLAHVSLDGRFIRANTCLCRLLHRSEAELRTLSFQDITHPDDLASDLDLLHEVLDGQRETYTMEKRYIRPGGGVVWADLSVSLLRDHQGQPLHFISIIADSHARKMAQQQVELVLSEANHRVKNLLSVVSAIVRSSSRSARSVGELEEAISARLAGIAASHDLLMGKSVTGGRLAELIHRQLEVFTDCAIERVALSGPPVQLTPAAIHAFGMVLHELATNACKYGSLSNDGGRVEVAWNIDPASDSLHFTWIEHDGPTVRETGRQGFGTRALLRMLSGSLGGTATHTLAPEGARFEATVPWSPTVAG